MTDYPSTVRPFYHMRHPDDPTLTRSFDLLWRGLELTTGAQREHRHDVLLAQAKDKSVDPGPISYYLDFFRYGAPPHGGFGFGLTRLLDAAARAGQRARGHVPVSRAAPAAALSGRLHRTLFHSTCGAALTGSPTRDAYSRPGRRLKPAPATFFNLHAG